MAQEQLQWKGPAPARPKSVHPQKWQEHREELCDLYSRMKLEDLMSVMKIRHKFTPSRRQYIYQFENWGVQKYNKRIVCHGESGQSTPTVEDPAGPSSSPCNRQRICFTPTFNDGPSPQGRRPGLSKPEVPPKKRQKLSNFLTERTCPDVALDFDAVKTQDDQTSKTPTYNEQQGIPVVMDLDGRNDEPVSGFADTCDNPAQLSGPEPSNSGSRLIFTLGDLGPMESDQSGADICDTNETTPKRLVDVSRSIDSFAADEMEDVRLAADFLFASRCLEDSFALYVLLLKRLKQFPDSNEWMMVSAIIGCARSSTTASHFQISRNLLEQKLSERPLYALDTAEAFLYRSLLGDLHRKQGDDEAARFHSRLAMQSTVAQQETLTPLPKDHRSFDFVLYQYLNRTLTSHGHFAVHKIRDQFLERKPGPFEVEDGKMRKPFIRSCLRWCISELNSDCFIYGSWGNLRSGGSNGQRTDLLAVYSDLWQRLQRLRMKTVPSHATLWYARAQQAMGISLAELLVTLCLMMLNASSNVQNVCSVNSFFTRPQYSSKLAIKALRGAEFLSECSDLKLAHAFLDAYSDLHTTCSESNATGDIIYNSLARDYTKSFLERSLLVQLPDVPISHPGKNGESQDGIDRSKASVPNLSIGDASIAHLTLTQSLNSSDYSSFQALRGCARGSLEEVLGDVLPSSVIKHASRSTLSLLQSAVCSSKAPSSFSSNLMDVRSSALDTLATVSSCVKDRVADLEASASRRVIHTLV